MIPFIDLKAQQGCIRTEVETAMTRVLDHGAYVMGPEVFELEKKLGEFCGAKHVITCSSGTDALSLILMAKGVKAGDAVFVPTFTFTATAEVVALVGATPVFVDVCEDTFNMCPESLTKALQVAKNANLNPVGVISVDLFGQPADYDVIQPFCKANDMWLLSDAAQSFGATYKGRKVGTIGDATATSFFPAKPLGCYGDGGAVFTDNDELAALMHSIRVHGQHGTDKYKNPRIGLNARMDTIQAAVLLEKLKIFPGEIVTRNELATAYNDSFSDIVKAPIVADDITSAWAQYTLCVDADKREAIQAALKDAGIPTAVYYPIPLHMQDGYKHFPAAEESLKVSEAFSKVVMSLPMHPYMKAEDKETIISKFREVILSFKQNVA